MAPSQGSLPFVHETSCKTAIHEKEKIGADLFRLRKVLKV
jgi:hypothetical protein